MAKKKKDTATETYNEVLQRLLDGYSLYQAVSEVCGIPMPSPKLTARVFKIRIAPAMQRLVRANWDKLRAVGRHVTTEVSIDMLNEAAEYARATGDGRLLKDIAMDRAKVAGISGVREREAEGRQFHLMNDDQRMTALADSMARMEELRAKLAARGITLTRETKAVTIDQPAPEPRPRTEAALSAS